MSILLTLRYNDSLVPWAVESLTAAKFKPLIISVLGFAMSYAINIFTFLYDFCLLLAQFGYTTVFIRKSENCVEIADCSVPWKIFSGAEKFVLQALQFKMYVPADNFQAGQA
jgi:hypothetical protein